MFHHSKTSWSSKLIGKFVVSEMMCQTDKCSTKQTKLRHDQQFAGDQQWSGQNSVCDQTHGVDLGVIMATSFEAIMLMIFHRKIRRPAAFGFYLDVNCAFSRKPRNGLPSKRIEGIVQSYLGDWPYRGGVGGEAHCVQTRSALLADQCQQRVVSPFDPLGGRIICLYSPCS